MALRMASVRVELGDGERIFVVGLDSAIMSVSVVNMLSFCGSAWRAWYRCP
jgi:hypothetical protein